MHTAEKFSKVNGFLPHGVEGSLATSLYFQFRDRAISLSKEAARLSDMVLHDLRYKRISDNVNLEVMSGPRKSSLSWVTIRACFLTLHGLKVVSVDQPLQNPYSFHPEN